MTLAEQIAEAKMELRRLVKRLKREEPAQKPGSLPYDPTFDPWKARARRERYLRMMQGVTVPPDSPLVTKVDDDA